jgi:hypothetical protein
MEIEYKGANCVVVKTKTGLVVVDPSAEVNLRDYGADAVILYTDERFEAGSKQSGFVIDMPGEYEHKDISIRGIQVRRHLDPEEKGKNGVVYAVTMAGVRFAFLGHVNAPISEEGLENLGVVDILFIPVGGNGYTLDAKDAATIIRQVEPKVAVPMHFDDGTKYEVPAEKLETFISEFGGTSEDKGASIKLKRPEDLPQGPVVWTIKKS